MTEELFRADAYLQDCQAEVAALSERGGIVLDRTVFYPTGGGQPGDSGRLTFADGRTIAIATTIKAPLQEGGEKVIMHVPADGQELPSVGDTVQGAIDWPRRYRHMRVHTCLHLLSAVLPYPVTGGQIGDGKGRLDFDLPEMTMSKEEIGEKLNALVTADRTVQATWITDAQLAAAPDLVKTMSVKPPTGAGKVRLIEVSDCDLQPCGGTHVARTGEIGAVRIRKIEKKGRQNRRVSIELIEP